MHGRESEEGNLRGHGEANSRSLASLCYWSIVLVFLSSCSSLEVNKYSHANLCLTGEGHLTFKSNTRQSSFRFESLAEDKKWLIGIQMPISGDRVIEISRQANKKENF